MEQGEVKVKKKILRGQYIKSTSRLNQTHEWNSEKKIGKTLSSKIRGRPRG